MSTLKPLAVSTLALLGALSVAPRSLSGEKTPFRIGLPGPVTGRPALTDEEMALFIKANDVAEKMRMKAVEEYLAGIDSGEEKRPEVSSRSGCASAALNQMMMEMMVGMMEETKGVEEAACREEGVDPEVYMSLLRRIVQVRDLQELEWELRGGRAAVAKLERKAPDYIATEALDFVYGMERGRLEERVRRIEERIEREARAQREAWARDRERAEKKLRKMPERDRADRGEIRLLREKVRNLERMYGAPGRELPGGMPEDYIAGTEKKIKRLESRLKKRAEERKQLEEILTSDPPPPKEPEAAVAEELAEAREALRAYEEEKASGRLLRRMVEGAEENLERKRAELALLEEETARSLEDPAMRQALRDRSAVLRHAGSLVFDGSSLLPLPMP